MRKPGMVSACIIGIIVLLAGCVGGTVDTVLAGLDTPFTLAVGQTAVITGEGLELRFENVIEDSRCPLNVECIWEGRASYTVRLTYEGNSYNMVLTEVGLGGVSRDTFLEYEITASLLPYPEAPGGIAGDDYRLRITVVKRS
jgi:hypothetical protein